jgi:hypothetical protein
MEANNSLSRFWRARLKNLCRERRFGNDYLPDDDEGRSILIALLSLGGLPDAVALEFAWWCEAELPTLKRQASRTKWRNIGKLIGITTKELGDYKLWCFGVPADQTPEEFEVWKKKRRKEQDAKRSKKYRDKLKVEKEAEKVRMLQMAKQMAKTHSNPRHTEILEMLAESRYLSVAEIMKKARKSHAFVRSCNRTTTWVKGPPENVIVSDLRKTVHRSLKQLEAKGAIRTFTIPGERGPERLATLSMASWHPSQDDKVNNDKDLSQNQVRHASRERDGVCGIASDGIQSLPNPQPYQTNALPFRVIPSPVHPMVQYSDDSEADMALAV